VAIDTSGQISVDKDIWVVAIRRQNQLHYCALHINQKYERKFHDTENWREKFSAILFFKTSNEVSAAFIDLWEVVAMIIIITFHQFPLLSNCCNIVIW
jgi:hypothetical protein